MKTAIYIEDGIVQLVITPESDFEKNALTSFNKESLSAKIMTSSFYDCRGGWTKQAQVYDRMLGRENDEDKSLILRVEDKVGE